MSVHYIPCTECAGPLLINTGSLVNTSKGDQTIHVKCPLCSESIDIGYVSESYEPPAASEEQEESVDTGGGTTAEATDGGQSGGNFGLSNSAAPNEQRSDTLKPNNQARRTAAANRSNQMNPNNPAYRSSRG